MLDHIAVRSDVRAHDVQSEYTSSYRANAACVRELSRLYEEIAASIAEAQDIPADAKGAAEPVVRRSPARCLVQLGPVALTVAWLQRAQGTVADGELLVVVWKGAVAVQAPRGFERTADRAGASSATAVWETVLSATAESEAGWAWVPAGVADVTLSSTALAEQCIERLRTAHAECARAR